MLCGAEEKIDEVLRFKSNMDSGMFLPVQLAAAKALTLEKDWHDELNAVYSTRRQKVFELLQLLHCKFSRQQAGMFVWAKASPTTPKEGLNKHQLGTGGMLSDEILYNCDVFLTPGGIFGDAGNNYIRVSLCAPVEKFEEAIQRIQDPKSKN